MKYSESRQVISLRSYADESWRVVRSNSYSVYLLGLGISSVLLFSGLISIRWALAIPCIPSGIVGILGSDYVSSQIAVWVDNMMVFQKNEQMADPPQAAPVKGTKDIGIEITDDGDSVLWTVRISTDQLQDICRVSCYEDKLIRRHLDPSVWPNLTRRWQTGEIVRMARKLGFIGTSSEFINQWGESIIEGPPEVGAQTGIGTGVGG